MTFPQVVSMVTFAIGVAGLIWVLARPAQRDEPKAAEPAQVASAARDATAGLTLSPPVRVPRAMPGPC